MSDLDITSLIQDVNRVFAQQISKLPYFNDKNLLANGPTFKKIITDAIPIEGCEYSAAVYIPSHNTMLIVEKHLTKNIYCHEALHMVSYDSEKGQVGYDKSEFKYFNEAATEWLTSKYFGVTEESTYYTSGIVEDFDFLVQKYGEERMFNGYFEADLSKMLSQFPVDDMIFILDVAQNMTEKMSKTMTR